MSNFEQLFGHEAVGAAVARDFGELGTFNGRVVRFERGRDKEQDLYTVEYEDGDIEDLDTEEYNFAYALHLRREGWELEEDKEASDTSYDSEGTQGHWRPPKVTSLYKSFSVFPYFQGSDAQTARRNKKKAEPRRRHLPRWSCPT